MASLGVSLLAAADDVLGVVLQKVDAAALCQLKAASVAWRAHARRELCRRLCRRKQGAITDLDVQVLNDAGRPWEVVVAGRQQPPLARAPHARLKPAPIPHRPALNHGLASQHRG